MGWKNAGKSEFTPTFDSTLILYNFNIYVLTSIHTDKQYNMLFEFFSIGEALVYPMVVKLME
jgi:hypothetical protein